jgi:lipopolysaccharide biosynthesis glycosyltransferase
MLIDIKLWRRREILKRALELMRDRTLPYGEQDSLNVLFVGAWKRLHPRWNLQLGHFADPCLARVTETISDFDEALANGPTKPWHIGCQHPLAARWFECLDRTPLRGWRPETMETPREGPPALTE